MGSLEDVEAYWEYHKIVGDEVGDKLLSPKAYEKYKKTVVPERIRNRLYVSWRVDETVDCELIGPESQCFCQHRYRQHNTDNPAKNTSCRHCRCAGYEYIPRNGSQPARCKCKHFATDHDLRKKCGKCGCERLMVTLTCMCGKPAHAHYTCLETKAERVAAGRPVGRDVPYAAMGGLTGFSSLASGYMRLDPSGAQGDCVGDLNPPGTSKKAIKGRSNQSGVRSIPWQD